MCKDILHKSLVWPLVEHHFPAISAITTEIPFKTGVITKEQIAGEIGQVLCGMVAGRTDDEQITVFDATGLAPLDLVTAKAAVRLAYEKNMGVTVEI